MSKPEDDTAGATTDKPVRSLIEKLRAMQRPGAESDLTVMCAEAADALTELMEWRKLRDQVTLHVSLLRGVPAQLDRATFLHCAGADQLMQALELIAAPMRPDGSWNRDRAACQQLAAEALGRHADSKAQNVELTGLRRAEER